MSAQNLEPLYSALFEAGLKNRREVVGDAYVNKALQNGSTEFSYPGQQLVTEYWPRSLHSVRTDTRQMVLGQRLVTAGLGTQAKKSAQ